MENGDPNLLAQFVRVWKISPQGFEEDRDFIGQEGRVDAGATRQRGSLVKAIEGCSVGVESHSFEIAS